MKKILITLIKIYQKVFSLLIGSNKCRFEPTCSNYMIEAINKKGLLRGSFLGIWRILNCHPFSKKDRYNPVK
ncbi:MAG: membrane protein insertion efficiency factor YidD [Pelagibacterales bacterium]|nr:membrane protein insertion efficiency factor YidD [Pelagibacterales bacterium]